MLHPSVLLSWGCTSLQLCSGMTPRVGMSLSQPLQGPCCSLQLPRAGSDATNHPSHPITAPKSRLCCPMSLQSSHPGGRCGLGEWVSIAPACSWEGRAPRQRLGST